MKIVVAAVSASGRSSIGENREVFSRDLKNLSVPVGGGAGTQFDILWQFGEAMSSLSLPRELTDTKSLAKHPESVDITWLVTSKPGSMPQMPFHQSDTLGLDSIVAGEVTLVLDEGEVLLNTGDMVVLPPGCSHSWRPGPNGYTMAGIFVVTRSKDKA